MKDDKKDSNSPTHDFEKIDFTEKDFDGKATMEGVLNPFKDSLANSERIPTTQKLEVHINDNYLASSSTAQDPNSFT